MLTLNIDNPVIENYFHSSTDEMFHALEAIALNKAHLVATNNPMPQSAIEIQRDIEAYRRGELKTTPLDEAFWDEMDSFIDSIPQK